MQICAYANFCHITVSMPMEPNTQFSTQQCPSTLNQSKQMQGVPYSEAVGSVLWPVVVSRPDSVYVIGILAQFIQNPGSALLGDALLRPTSPPIFLHHLCIFLLIVASPRWSALAVGFCFSGYYHYTSAGIVVITAKTKSNTRSSDTGVR